MAQLIIVASPSEAKSQKEHFVLIDKETIGSSPANTIILKSPTIKAYHLEIKVQQKDGVKVSTASPGAKFTINGTPTHKAFLQHGDIIEVGGYTLLFDDQNEKKLDLSSRGQEAERIPDESVIESKIGLRQTPYDSAHEILKTFDERNSVNKKLVTLYKIANAISGILDLEELLEKFLEIILEEFSADRGFISLYDQDNDKMTPMAVLVKNSQLSQSPQVSHTIMAEVLQTKESILCENTMNDPRTRGAESMIRHKIMSAMCVPLIRNNEILGIIQVDSYQRNNFNEGDLDLLTKVALQAAMVIENARFYQAHERFGRNLLALSHATQNISSYLNQNSILQDATSYAAKIFECHKSLAFLLEDSQLKLEFSVGLSPKEVESFPLTEAFNKILSQNQPLLVRGKKDLPPELQAAVHPGVLEPSLMLVPIREIAGASQQQNTEQVGLLCVSGKINQKSFSSEDLRLFSILASHTAIALSNSKFYQALKKKEEEIARWNQELEKRVNERTEKLESIQGQLIQSEKMATVGLLAAGVAHEFNNIIASMYGFAQIARSNEKYKDKLVETVINQCKRASSITESLLSFSKQRDAEEEIDVAETLEEVLRFTMSALEKEGIQVVKDFQASPKIVANSNKIQQVFENIIINAWHAIEKNGTITISLYVKDKKMYIRFTDDGKGIDQKHLSKIFDPFWTTKGSFGGGTQPGTGMGLYSCYHILKEHDGEITVESQVNYGTTFTVILPLEREKTSSSNNKLPNEKISSLANGKENILIVEDEPKIRELLENILQQEGFEVTTIGDGKKALELCRRKDFQLVFLDIKMPGELNGFKVFDEIRKINSKSKIALITGRAEDSTLMQYVGKADGYLRKPFAIDDVYKLVGSIE